MKKDSRESKTLQFVRELCKGHSEEEILDAEQSFKDYISIVRDICNRLEREGIELSDFDESYPI